MLDVIVVGGGPHGLRVAAITAGQGMNTVLLEEDKEVGVPRHCTGLLSLKAAKLIGDVALKSTVNKLRGVIIKTLRGNQAKVLFPKPVTLVLDRIKYDKLMAEIAINNGAELFLRHRVLGVVPKENYVKLKVYGPEGEFILRSRYVIVASGPHGSVYVPGYKRPNGLLPASQVLLRLKERVFRPDLAQIIISEYSKGFFGWVVPINAFEVLVGLATQTGNPRQALLYMRNSLELEGEPITYYHGIVVTGGPIKKLVYGDRILVVGDAAGHVKATTGGGLFYGYICSTLAGIHVVLENPSLYQSLCNKLVYGVLLRLKSIRYFVNNMPQSLIEKFIDILGERTVVQSLLLGDQDIQWDILKRLLRNPYFYASIAQIKR